MGRALRGTATLGPLAAEAATQRDVRFLVTAVGGVAIGMCWSPLKRRGKYRAGPGFHGDVVCRFSFSVIQPLL